MTAPEVVVIDYGVGNLLSVRRALEHCGAHVTLTSDPERIAAAERVVLPGVGAFASAMQTLSRLGLVPAIREVVRRDNALLCICLGMQLLLDESEEFGVTDGLKLIRGRVVPIPSTTVGHKKQKIPRIGWNDLQPSAAAGDWRGTLLEDIVPGEAAYFVHSFMAVPDNAQHRLADTFYGGHAVPAVVSCGRITGLQFHPEKSGEVGLNVFRRFIRQ
jgi:imidazole glycerol-phosphate synthase subunit HisH